MDPEAPIGDTRRGSSRWRRTVLLLAAMPIVLVLLASLILTSGFTSRWVASKIQARAGGLQTRLGSVTWSPWNGVCLNSLEILQPVPLQASVDEPLLRIKSVKLAPVWRAWLRGRPEVQSITLDSPCGVLPLELISELSRSAPAVQQTPPIAPSPPAPPKPPAPVPTAPAPPTAPTSPQQVPTPPPTTPPPVVAPPVPTGWVHMQNASLAVIHAGSRRKILEISSTHGSIPIAGDSAQSHFEVGAVSLLDHPLTEKLTAELNWTAPVLSLKPLEFEIDGFKFIAAGQLAKFSGLPLQIEAQLPRQPLKPVSLPFDGQASAESVAVNARFRGLLLAPASWQGDLITEAISPTLSFAAHEAKFDKGSAVTVLRGGAISCVDARLIGDGLSLLGNATLLADGRAAGAARVVSAPETLSTIAKQAFPMLQEAPSLTPLSTPQRAAFDVVAFGNIHQLFLRLGMDGPVLKLNH